MPRFLVAALASLLAFAPAPFAFAAGKAVPAGPLPPPPAAHPVTIERPWTRPTSGGAGGTAAVYLTIVNGGADADQLLGAMTPVAAQAGLHAVTIQGDVVRMRVAPVIPIPAEGRIVLRPGVWHIMLMGLKKPLEKHTSFPLTLSFKKAGSLTVEVAVRNDEPGSFWGLPENEKAPKKPQWGSHPSGAGNHQGEARKGVGSLL
jgi:copper(I)-binding protein